MAGLDCTHAATDGRVKPGHDGVLRALTRLALR
jgi:hypothetical protein